MSIHLRFQLYGLQLALKMDLFCDLKSENDVVDFRMSLIMV